MNFCTICNMKFADPEKHILQFHKPLSDPNNQGDFLCPLCNVKVGNKQRHYCSALHRDNVKKDEVDIFYGLKEYIIHFNKYCDEKTVKALEKEEGEIEDPYWSAAREDLSKEDYKELKEHANGRGKNTNGNYTGHTGLGRLGRTPKGKQANSKKTGRRKNYSRI